MYHRDKDIGGKKFKILFPFQNDWSKIQESRQQEDTSVSNYRHCLENSGRIIQV